MVILFAFSLRIILCVILKEKNTGLFITTDSQNQLTTTNKIADAVQFEFVYIDFLRNKIQLWLKNTGKNIILREKKAIVGENKKPTLFNLGKFNDGTVSFVIDEKNVLGYDAKLDIFVETDVKNPRSRFFVAEEDGKKHSNKNSEKIPTVTSVDLNNLSTSIDGFEKIKRRNYTHIKIRKQK